MVSHRQQLHPGNEPQISQFWKPFCHICTLYWLLSPIKPCQYPHEIKPPWQPWVMSCHSDCHLFDSFCFLGFFFLFPRDSIDPTVIFQSFPLSYSWQGLIISPVPQKTAFSPNLNRFPHWKNPHLNKALFNWRSNFARLCLFGREVFLLNSVTSPPLSQSFPDCLNMPLVTVYSVLWELKE